jgi:hypothetical protein
MLKWKPITRWPARTLPVSDVAMEGGKVAVWRYHVTVFPLLADVFKLVHIMPIGGRPAEQNRRTRGSGALPRATRSTGECWRPPADPVIAIWSQPFVVIKECCPDYGLATNGFVAKLTAPVRRHRRHAGPHVSASGAHVE